MSKLDELERLADAATPGPWEPVGSVVDCGPEERLHYVSWKAFIECFGSEDDPANGKTVSEANASFIAKANPATIKQMAAIMRLQNEYVKLMRDYGPPVGFGNTTIDEALRLFDAFDKGE